MNCNEVCAWVDAASHLLKQALPMCLQLTSESLKLGYNLEVTGNVPGSPEVYPIIDQNW